MPRGAGAAPAPPKKSLGQKLLGQKSLGALEQIMYILRGGADCADPAAVE
jgi:hypothetical protein